MNRPKSGSLVYLLRERGLIGDRLLSELTHEEPARVIERLLSLNETDKEALAQFLAIYMGLDYLPEASVLPEPDMKLKLAALDKHRLEAVPLRAHAGSIVVAVANPLDLELGDRLATVLQSRVRLVVAAADSLRKAKSSHMSSHARLQAESNGFGRVPDAVAPADTPGDMRDAAPVVRLVDTLLRTAVERGASDIHIESGSAGTQIRFRIDGALQPAMEPLSTGLHDPVVTRIKVLAGLDVAEKRAAQDGRFSLAVDGKPIDFRVSILPGGSEGVVLRILRHVDLSQSAWHLDQLGFGEPLVHALRHAVHAPQGLVLISGPTGSGKTTTLYAALAEIDSRTEKVITIEDPVEYRLDGIMQISVNEQRKFTFANGLRSILRHDPDKIMVGEIRDRETAEIAIQSALTGHLVLSTVHANGAVEAINRFAHMGVDRTFVVDALVAIFAQRLVRVICPVCKSPAPMDASIALNEQERALLQKHEILKGKGCPECNFSGYRGREAIGEFVRFTPELKDALFGAEAGRGMRSMARKHMQQTLRECAIEKVAAGMTSLEEVARVTVAD